MTTNVYDTVSGILSSDSRWSISKGDWVAYIQDTDYDKLVLNAKLTVGFLFAGDMPIIDEWKTYITNGMKRGTRPTISPGMSISVIQVDIVTGKIVFQSNNLLRSLFSVSVVRALFGGTGASPAKICWDVNKCALQAIGSAAKMDPLSGGSVVHFNRTTLSGNMKNSVTAKEAAELFNDRGILMNIATNYTPMLLKDAANDPSNPEVQAIAKSILSGGSPLTAPFPGMNEPWSAEKIAEFEAALDQYEED